MFKEYAQYAAIGLAQLILLGAMSATEALVAAIFQADKLNPELNAIIHRLHEYAYNAECSGCLYRIFSGVLYLLKDLSFYVEGEPIKLGSRSINIIPPVDSEMVQLSLADEIERAGRFTKAAFEKTKKTG